MNSNGDYGGSTEYMTVVAELQVGGVEPEVKLLSGDLPTEEWLYSSSQEMENRQYPSQVKKREK